MNKLLYIDDDLDSLELYQDILSPDFDVEIASCPRIGLQKLNEGDFAAVLLDVHMPVMNGFEVFQEIISTPHLKEIPVFFISSENTAQNRVTALSLGSEDFLSREMDAEEVIIRIKTKLEKVKKRKLVLVFGDIVLDQAELKAYCDNDLIELTQIEYKLLYLLLKGIIDKPEGIVLREEMIEFIWPVGPEMVMPKTLNTHLSNLRKKLNSKTVELISKRHLGVTLSLIKREGGP